jgi:hypothetical protein
LVSNARIELSTGFYQSPLDIPLDKFELAFDSQVRAFHILVREMVEILNITKGCALEILGRGSREFRSGRG